MARALIMVLLLVAAAAAQTSPFLPENLYDKLVNEISGDNAYDHLRTLTQFHTPNGAGRGFKAEAQWIADQARLAGLSDVVIHQLPTDDAAWTPLSGELWLLEPGQGGEPATKLGSYPEIATSIADYSPSVRTEAELVDVGAGLSDRDYEDKDVKGKIVLAGGPVGEVEKQAVRKRGALGIVSYYSSRTNPADYPDQVAWIHRGRPTMEKEPVGWAFVISWRKGMHLRDRLNPRREQDVFTGEWKDVPAQPLRVRVSIESETTPNPTQGLVEGWIRGKRSDQQIVLTAHVQEERYSANDDRSGCANLLEIARALNRLIAEGKLPRPERDIRFWWANEISAEYQWFADHPDDRKNIFVNINQDMVGVNQTIGGISRVQHVTRTPWSRPTFFNDVVESIIMALYHGNNSYLAARQAGSYAPGSQYSKPIYSHLGSRDRYSVEIVPYFDSTDHMVFNDAFVGAVHGGTTFTNWPDEYIHSSDDDLWQMDRTQFKRNAVAVTAIAWFMANAGPDDVGTVVEVVAPAAIARVAADLRAVASARHRDPEYDDDFVNSHSLKREHLAAESIKSIAADSQTALHHIDLAASWIARQAPHRPGVSDSKINFMRAPQIPAGGQRIPVRSDVATYVKKQQDIKKVPGFHPLMRYEALNFADGKRSIWDIYTAVRAESLAAGEWYYGHVTPEMVQQFFDYAAEAGVVTLKDVPPPAKPKK